MLGTTLKKASRKLQYADYEDAYKNLEQVSKLFAMTTGLTLKPSEIACLLVCMKISKQRRKEKKDNLVELCVYTDLWQHCLDIQMTLSDTREEKKGDKLEQTMDT